MDINSGVKCDVIDCTHNEDGCACSLKEIEVTCHEKHCTCCGSYLERGKVNPFGE